MKKYLAAIIFFIGDVFLKWLALKTTPDFFLIPKIFALRLFQNPNLAFNLPLPQNIIIILSLVIIAGLFVLAYKKSLYRFLIFIIILGAVSNLADRIVHGFVTDYFYLWPISYFNLADLFIFAGVLLLAYKSLKNKNL